MCRKCDVRAFELSNWVINFWGFGEVKHLMAFSVKISGISKKTGGEVFNMEPPWWNSDQLRKDERFVVSNETGSYFDYDADVSISEMRELHERFKLAATAGVYGSDQWREIKTPNLEKLDEVLYSRSDDYSHFHITVFEWESGL